MVAALALLLGLTAAWAVQERTSRQRLRGRVDDAVRHTTFVQAHIADLMHLLARQDTQVIRLTGNGPARTNTATIIWNPAHSGGYVYSDLPGSHRLIASAQPGADTLDLAQFDGAHPPAAFHLPAGAAPTDVRFAIVDQSTPQRGGQPRFLFTSGTGGAF